MFPGIAGSLSEWSTARCCTRIGWAKLSIANALAYFAAASVTKKKKIITLTLVVS